MRVLVTGAGRGIGRAISLRLARDAAAAGGTARIAACDLRADEHLASLARELRAIGAEVVTPLGDLADPEVPRQLVDEAVAAFGGLDGVVSNAGVSAPKPLLEMTLEEWERVMSINARAGWLLCRAAHAALKASRGAIVTICSMSGLGPHTGLGAYSPSKAAMIVLTRMMAQEWAADGIRANAVSPGFVETSMTESLYRDPAVRAAREAVVPLHRIAEPADIAAVVAFLLGPDSRYMTGQNLLVDGGFVDSLLDRIPGRPANTAMQR